MKIAVTYDNGNVFEHFGRTDSFKVYEVEDGKVLSGEVISSHGAGHGALAGVLYGDVSNVAVTSGTISGGDFVGGLIGNANSGSLVNVSNAATVTGSNDVGGIVGNIGGTVNVNNARNTGNVTADMGAGGIAGQIMPVAGEELTISNAYNSGAVKAQGSSYEGSDTYYGAAGGIAGTILANSEGTYTVKLDNVFNEGVVLGNPVAQYDYSAGYENPAITGYENQTGGILGAVSADTANVAVNEIGRASCRERV